MLTAQELQGTPPETAASDTPRIHPDLADLIPLEAALPGRFATLRQKMGGLVDLTDMAARLAATAVSLEAYTRQLQRLQAATGSDYYQLIALKAAIRRERETLAKVSANLTAALRQIGVWRLTWLAEKRQWNAWQSSARHDALLDNIKQTFITAHHTIDAALALLRQQIKPILATQQQARDIQVRLDVLATDVEGVLATMGDHALRHVTPPMLSPRYMAQLDSRLWYDVRNGLEEIAWPDRRFMAQQGWVMLLQGVLSLLVSGLLQRLLVQGVLAARHMETGVQLAIARLVHYALVFVGLVVALATLGFEFTQLTILLSALGVGIGFGLQAIVNNFLCGLILLFERPIRVGDTIELGGQWAQIRKIGLRATTVQTFDQADVILPNSDLINNQVTNWTLTNRHARIILPVGVAYGSDVPLVMQTLVACAAENDSVMNTPEPLVFFRKFGDSSLDFELRAWIWDVGNRFRVISELHQEVERRFREAGIEIAFPQRDLHIRAVDTLAASKSPLPFRSEA